MNSLECLACGTPAAGVFTTPTRRICVCPAHAVTVWRDNGLNADPVSLELVSGEPLMSSDLVDEAGGHLTDAAIIQAPTTGVCEECPDDAIVEYAFTELDDWLPPTWTDPGCWVTETEWTLSACTRHVGEVADIIRDLPADGRSYTSVTVTVHPAAAIAFEAVLS